MSSDLNRTILIGRLTRDIESKYTQTGTAVASFSLAVNYTTGSKDNRKEQVSFIDCTAWAGTAEILTQYGKKGKRIAVEGRLQQNRWDDQDGKKRSKLEVVVENFYFLSAKESEPGNPLDGEDVTGQVDNPFADDDLPY